MCGRSDGYPAEVDDKAAQRDFSTMSGSGFRRTVYYRLSPAWRRRARRMAFAPLDAWSALRGGRSYNGIPLPQRGEVFTGGGDFLDVGMRFLDYFRDLGDLQPANDVMEIGSGQGRMAIPLTSYLDESGSYMGFDVVADAVADCEARVSSRFPRFRFVHVDVMNDLYTETGTSAADFDFPFGDDAFDFVFATSVFSHMPPDEIERYIVESRRVVRPGGRLFATLFLMDDEAQRASAGSPFDFPHQIDGSWYMALHPRSANVAITPDRLHEMATKAGWSDIEIRPGDWSGRTGETLDYQDVAILR
jgi:SAM-dependent methyltransferase